MRRAIFLTAAGLLICCVSAKASPIDVLEMTGRVECAFANSVGWRPLAQNERLHAPVRIRAGKASRILIRLGDPRELVVELDEDSVLRIRSPRNFSLEKGSLMANRQNDEIAPLYAKEYFVQPLLFETGRMYCRLRHGGLTLQRRDQTQLLQLFGEEADIWFASGKANPIRLLEGSQIMARTRPGQDSSFEIVRMDLGPYNRWRDWTRHLYERKDEQERKMLDALLKD